MEIPNPPPPPPPPPSPSPCSHNSSRLKHLKLLLLFHDSQVFLSLLNNVVYDLPSLSAALAQFEARACFASWPDTWPLFCRFAVWCYLPRFVRRQFWNESSKSCGKSCWTPSREPLFSLRWVTRVWVWDIFPFPFSVALFVRRTFPSDPLLSSTCLSLPPVSQSLHLSTSLPHNTQITVQEMKQHDLSKSSHVAL